MLTAVSFAVDSFADTADANLGDGIAEDSLGNTSLRAAIHEANALGVSAEITLPAGTYDLSLVGVGYWAGDLDITGDITILGDGPGSTIIDATSFTDERIFDVFGDLELSGVTLTGADITTGANGIVGGAIWVRTSGELDISDSAIVGNAAGQVGGGIYNDGILSVSNSVITENSAVTFGGGIRNIGTATVNSTILANNTAAGAGPDAFGTFTSDGQNLLSDTANTTGFSSDHVGTPDYVVTSIVDTFQHSDDSYALSVREAVDLANTDGTDSEAWLPAWDFVLTRDRGTNVYDTNVSYGDLDIKDDLTIRGVSSANGSATSIAWKSGIVDEIFDLLGDFDNDGQAAQGVNGSDFLVWQAENGSGSQSSSNWGVYAADADDDGDVDSDDLDIWQDYYGNTLDIVDIVA